MRVLAANRHAGEEASHNHPNGKTSAGKAALLAALRAIGRLHSGFPANSHARKMQREMPKLAMMTWIAAAAASKKDAVHKRRSSVAATAARIATVASVRGCKY